MQSVSQGTPTKFVDIFIAGVGEGGSLFLHGAERSHLAVGNENSGIGRPEAQGSVVEVAQRVYVATERKTVAVRPVCRAARISG
jgi:hypothetical protein